MNKIYVYNDDHNTFEHVQRTLIECCGHDSFQAEQCALVIHNKGKCDVKSGYHNELFPIYLELINNGLNASIN
jgi:ATP-dependent Clp protease adaptor protein ClpS